jgi:2-iminobutanoate/2-iminopropanoate deaminase
MARTAVEVHGVAPPQAFYSHGIVATGPVVYVAGQVAIDEGGAIVQGDAEAQTRKVLRNLARVVESAGASLDDVVKTMVFLVDIADRDAVGRVREEFFGDPPPANTLLVVAGLANPAFLVEIEAIAVLPAGAPPGGTPSAPVPD